MRLITGRIDNTLAESLENLGALNNTGVFEVKPFKDWKGASVWKEKIFSMRLCNAGEILDITSSMEEKNEKVVLEITKFEILSRSIISIDGRALINEEELEKYNIANETNFQSPREWISIYLHNLEKVVVDRLDAVYGSLALKQARFLQGNVICGITNKLFSKKQIPEGSFYLKYGLAEILTPEGMQQYTPEEYKEMFDIVSAQTKEVITSDVVIEKEKVEDNINKEGDTFEERKIKMERKDTEEESSKI